MKKLFFFGYYLKTRYFIKRELNKVYRSNTNFTYSQGVRWQKNSEGATCSNDDVMITA